MRVPIAVALLVLLLGPAAAQRSEPFVPVGVWYEPGTLAPSAVLRDLQGIRGLGFNHVKTLVRWTHAEPVRGTFRLEPLDAFLALADQAGIRVIVQPQVEPPPEWTAKTSEPPSVAAFVEAIAARAKAHPSFHSIAAIVDPYRVSMYPKPRNGPAWSPVQLAWRLDAIRSAAAEKGWSVGELQAGPAAGSGGPATEVTGADVRFWTWAAISRGARAITFASWSTQSSPVGSTYAGLAGVDGSASERAPVAGEVSGTITRNAALFAPLRPRRARVAVVSNPFWDVAPVAASVVAYAGTMEFCRRVFEWNVQTDIIHPEELAIGEAANYRAIFAAVPEMLPPTARHALDLYVKGGGRVLTARQAEPSDLILLQPEVPVQGGGGYVEARFLESADTLVLIGLNHADTPQTVTFTFAPGTPEAIWQNIETGASVSFVQGAGSLSYQHAFAARDAMVLVIRTRLR